MIFGVPIDIPIRTPAGELSVPGWDMGLQLVGGKLQPPCSSFGWVRAAGEHLGTQRGHPAAAQPCSTAKA